MTIQEYRKKYFGGSNAVKGTGKSARKKHQKRKYEAIGSFPIKPNSLLKNQRLRRQTPTNRQRHFRLK